MKRQLTFLFIIFLIINLMGFKTASITKEHLLVENQLLKERIAQFEAIDTSEIKTVVELNKMNVVYRGVNNPMTISMPNAVKIEASALGLKKIDDFGNYELSPGSGLKVDVLIKGIMKNGDTIEDIKTFRIKDINKPVGMFNRIGHGNDFPIEFTKESLINGKVGIRVEDYLFDLDYNLKGFKIKNNKNTPISVDGNILNEEAKDLVRKSKINDSIYIFDIRLDNPANVCLPVIAPIRIKIVE